MSGSRNDPITFSDSDDPAHEEAHPAAQQNISDTEEPPVATFSNSSDDEEEAAACAAGGFAAGGIRNNHGRRPARYLGYALWPWRAQDFWREALLPESKEWIKRWHLRYQTKEELGNRGKEMELIEQQKELPPEWFVDVTGWMWSEKADGYFVELRRDDRRDTNKWTMWSRRGVRLFPPDNFLTGLEQNTELPSIMYGELVTGVTDCLRDYRLDTDKRTWARNEQFKLLQKIWTRSEEAFEGLRVKIFAFPQSKQTMWDTFLHYKSVMLKTLEHHPHIGMCNFGRLDNTKHAIDIFKSVVQMGLEGIVIVNADDMYGALLNRQADDACNLFKLKQKICTWGENLHNRQITKTVKKDGEDISEHEYTVFLPYTDKHGEASRNKIIFSDRKNRKDCNSARIKYMERCASVGNTFQHHMGYRHIHFATVYDMSVEVPAKLQLTEDAGVRQILGINAQRERIPSWDTDAYILNTAARETKLFNPRTFTQVSKRQRLDANIYSITLCLKDMTLDTCMSNCYKVI